MDEEAHRDELLYNDAVSAAFPSRKRRRSDDYSMSSPILGSRSIFNRDAKVAYDSDGPFDEEAPKPPASKKSIIASAKVADENITPFLVRHIPDQYAPLGPSPNAKIETPNPANSRYCYRHRPDLKCRRQADEPSMDQLQRVSLLVSSNLCLKIFYSRIISLGITNSPAKRPTGNLARLVSVFSRTC